MSKKKVVIIDDEEDLCLLMKAYLMHLNYDVHLAFTLTKGLDLLKEIIPDVLFIDNNLPDGLGWEKVPFVSKNYPSCKINMISAYQYASKEINEPNEKINIIEKPMSLSLLKKYL